MLESRDKYLLIDFANIFLIHYDEDISWPLSILWTNEAHFMLNDNVNSKNCVHRADNNPHDEFAKRDCAVWYNEYVHPRALLFEDVTDGDL